MGTACGKFRTPWPETNSGWPRRNRRISDIGTPRASAIAFDR
jgi:hypothetical protein